LIYYSLKSQKKTVIPANAGIHGFTSGTKSQKKNCHSRECGNPRIYIGKQISEKTVIPANAGIH